MTNSRKLGALVGSKRGNALKHTGKAADAGAKGPLYAVEHPLESARLIGGGLCEVHAKGGSKIFDYLEQPRVMHVGELSGVLQRDDRVSLATAILTRDFGCLTNAARRKLYYLALQWRVRIPTRSFADLIDNQPRLFQSDLRDIERFRKADQAAGVGMVLGKLGKKWENILRVTGGRPVEIRKWKLYMRGTLLRDEGLSWSKVGRKIFPNEKNPSVAIARARTGVLVFRKAVDEYCKSGIACKS